jgi:hypothetical protein
MGMTRRIVCGLAMVAAVSVGFGASPAAAAPTRANPTPLTDLVAQVFSIGTGGTQRVCATSPLGFPVHCVEGVAILPSADPNAYAVTYGHYVFCKGGCGGVLGHELVHVHQFEYYGDAFGPMYLLEAIQHGDGCANIYEAPAYGC